MSPFPFDDDLLSDRTGLRLEAILREYMVRLERSRMTSPGLDEGRGEVVKPLNLIVVTDGGTSLLSPLFLEMDLAEVI
jgi:hypothetical protein